MATLHGQQPQHTYEGLIKTSDENAVTTEKSLEDGAGNALPISISPTAVGFSGNIKDNAGSAGNVGEVLSVTSTGLKWQERTFTFNQTVSTGTWVIAHNLGAFPSVAVIDSVGNFVIGDIDYTNNVSLTLTFNSAFKGKAYLN
jgi:hypothetical protein|tara:strand:+ start:197 stop:625 length:429 start_codon:yes stop_codon:yes gene_type:complete